MIVVADTSPICYLLLIGHIDLLPTLFGKIIIPQAVCDELMNEGAPGVLRAWIIQPPAWLEIQHMTTPLRATSPDRLHAGELEAIALAEQLNADLIILDEKAARETAFQCGLKVTGLLGILDEATARGLIDSTTAIDRLQRTTFRASPRILKALLDRHN